MKLAWSHCVLRVRDLEAMVAFYSDVLGFQVSDRGLLGPDGPKIVFLSGSSSDHHQIAFAPTRTDEEATSLEHNAFRTGSIADVRAMFERVSEDDRASRVMPLTHGNAVSVYFSDPELNGIEVFCDTPWHVKQPKLKKWDPSLSDEEVLAFVEGKFRDDSEFMPMEQYRAERAKAFGERD
jgi:catechol-2,3-dioxygenase